MKFNCFFLMPFLDEFPVFLRNELDQMYNSDMGEMFDIAEARMVLQQKRYSLPFFFSLPLLSLTFSSPIPFATDRN